MGGKCQRWWRKQQDRAQRFPFLCGWLRPGVCIRKSSYPCGSCPAPGPGPAPGSEPRQHHGHTGLCWMTYARAVPSLGQRAQGLCCRAQPIPQRLWGAHGCCGAQGAISTAPTSPFLAHSRAGCQLCRDFAFSSMPGVFQCLFSYGAAPVLLSEALPEVPPAQRALQLCQTYHRLGRGTVLVPPDQLAQRQAELEHLEPSMPGCWKPLSWGSARLWVVKLVLIIFSIKHVSVQCGVSFAVST